MKNRIADDKYTIEASVTLGVHIGDTLSQMDRDDQMRYIGHKIGILIGIAFKVRGVRDKILASDSGFRKEIAIGVEMTFEGLKRDFAETIEAAKGLGVSEQIGLALGVAAKDKGVADTLEELLS